jgi:hypothetical protein
MKLASRLQALHRTSLPNAGGCRGELASAGPAGVVDGTVVGLRSTADFSAEADRAAAAAAIWRQCHETFFSSSPANKLERLYQTCFFLVVPMFAKH